MDWQLIITLLIIAYAAGYTVYAVIKLILRKKSCGGSCSGCDFKRELHKQQRNNRKQLSRLKYVPENNTGAIRIKSN